MQSCIYMSLLLGVNLCRYTDQQRQRLAALDAERTALQRRQEQMRAIAADLDRAGRLAVATDKLSQIRQGLQEADEEEQEEARKLLAVMKQVCGM